jgi:peptide/nickel transport system permease protein
MFNFFIRRLLMIPVALLLIHFLSFSYAHIARPIRAARTPYARESFENEPLWPTYQAHLQDLLTGSLDQLPGGRGEFLEVIRLATVASLGLLIPVLLVAILAGLGLGMQAVHIQPPATARWLSLLSTIGLATPSFYLGSLLILAIVYYALWKGPGTQSILPLKGFGWDNHMILPMITLIMRPSVQIAQMTAELMVGELGKQYVIAARSIGHTWRNIRWRQTMRNILAAVILTIGGSLRLLMGELIVVEWLFNWPGLGNLMASTLVPGQYSTVLGSTPLFLNPPLVSVVVTIIAAIFLISDLIASSLVRIVDPRLRPHEAGGEA